MIDWSSRSIKRERSRLLFDLLSGREPARGALFLPGQECLCIHEALEAGVVSLGTSVLAVEREHEVARMIVSHLGRMGFTNAPRTIEGRLGFVPGERLPDPLDLVYLDLCTYPDTPLASWIQDTLSKRLHVGSVIAMTTTCDSRDRGNEIIKRARVVLVDSDPAPIRIVQRDMPIHGGSSRMGVNQALSAALLLCLLGEWRLKGLGLVPYRDGSREMCLNLFEVQHAASSRGWPTLADIYERTQGIDFSQHLTEEGFLKRSANGMRFREKNSRRRIREGEIQARLAGIDLEKSALPPDGVSPLHGADRLENERGRLLAELEGLRFRGVKARVRQYECTPQGVAA